MYNRSMACVLSWARVRVCDLSIFIKDKYTIIFKAEVCEGHLQFFDRWKDVALYSDLPTCLQISYRHENCLFLKRLSLRVEAPFLQLNRSNRNSVFAFPDPESQQLAVNLKVPDQNQ